MLPLDNDTADNESTNVELFVKITVFDFEKYFSAIVTAEDIQHHKPAPDTFLRCAELIQVKPQRCLVFEDGDLGIQAGLNAGMDVFDVRVNKLLRSPA